MANNLSDLKIIYQADSVRCSAEGNRTNYCPVLLFCNIINQTAAA